MSTPRSIHENSLTDLKTLIARDLAASNDLAARITQLRDDITKDKKLPQRQIHLMEVSNKDMNKELVARIEQIADSEGLTATDREMLQALNARLAVGDMQAMRLAELRDIEYEARGLNHDGFTELAELSEWAKKKKEAKEEYQPLLELASPMSKTAGSSDREKMKNPLSARDASETGYDGDIETSEGEESEPDRSAWPVLYRVMGVDPATWHNQFQSELDRALKKLSLKFDPKRFPNDTDAPARWAAVSKTYETLKDSGRRQWYDDHGQLPAGLKDYDFSRLDVI